MAQEAGAAQAGVDPSPAEKSGSQAETQAAPSAPRGPVGYVVHSVFRLFEWAILAVLVPVRALSVAVGRLVVFLLRLPFRALSLLFALAGYLIVALLVLLVVGGSLTLLAA